MDGIDGVMLLLSAQESPRGAAEAADTVGEPSVVVVAFSLLRLSYPRHSCRDLLSDVYTIPHSCE